jgi:transcription elongation GreA/GreB family factor
MGKRVDDEVVAEVPNGTVAMKVLAVSRTQS